MAVAKHMLEMLNSSSMIRKMFDDGKLLREKYGDKVSDFSLGNPAMDPPAEFTEALKKITETKITAKHSYMTNAGYPEVRSEIASKISAELETDFTAANVIMTCGAGGALNIALKSILNPGDEVLVSTPCFLVYNAYTSNHNGRLRLVKGKEDFTPDVEALAAAVTEKTAALIINSPNNPSGTVYSEEIIKDIADMLRKKSAETGRTIYIVSDEPYRQIVYDNTAVPSISKHYEHTIITTSYSKDLSIPGERIGWAAINPKADDAELLFDSMVMCNRDLGYTNAPALMQRVIGKVHGACVDIKEYKRKRDFLCSELKKMGYELIIPEGTFYIFPKAPGGDDIKFTQILKDNLILTVPGTGFSFPGHFRIAFCVSDQTIKNSVEGFRKAIESFK